MFLKKMAAAWRTCALAPFSAQMERITMGKDASVSAWRSCPSAARAMGGGGEGRDAANSRRRFLCTLLAHCGLWREGLLQERSHRVLHAHVDSVRCGTALVPAAPVFGQGREPSRTEGALITPHVTTARMVRGGNDDELDRLMASLGGPSAPRGLPPSQQPAIAKATREPEAPQPASRPPPEPEPVPQRQDTPPEGEAKPAPASTAPPGPRAPVAAKSRMVWPPPADEVEDQNVSHRAYMEDASLVVTDLCDDARFFFAAVYDGHGGRTAVDFVQSQLHANVRSELKASRGTDPAGAIVRAVDRTELTLRTAGAYSSGTTAAMVLIERMDLATPPGTTGPGPMPEPVKPAYQATVANVGDSHVFLLPRASGANLLMLTENHSPSNPAEVARVEAAGGSVVKGRLGGYLSVLRALGDHTFKADARGRGLVAKAFTTVQPLDPTDHSALVIVSDGVLEKLPVQRCADIVRGKLVSGSSLADAGAKGAAEALIQESLTSGTRDNVSAVVIVLNKLSP